MPENLLEGINVYLFHLEKYRDGKVKAMGQRLFLLRPSAWKSQSPAKVHRVLAGLWTKQELGKALSFMSVV